MTVDAAQTSYTTAGRHRRDIGSGRIRLTARLDADAGAQVLVNGYAVRPERDETVIVVPAGPMLVTVHDPGARAARPVEVEFVLGEGHTVDLVLTAPRMRLGSARLQVVGDEAPAA